MPIFKAHTILAFLLAFACNTYPCFAQRITSENNMPGSLDITTCTIYTDSNDAAVIQKSAELLQQDIELLTRKRLPIVHTKTQSGKNVILIGSLDHSSWIRELVATKKINPIAIRHKWEAYQLQLLHKPTTGIDQAFVITGNDRRGTAFGVFELSRQLGISPWYWWADVPVRKKTTMYIIAKAFLQDAPKVKYRGIFINDEAPALSTWSRVNFGGFNHQFYEKVFELMLRLKANYLWPAMWGNAFYDDDSLNIHSAEEYAIVIGTSHHEPLMRAHDEWRRYGKNQLWNYDSSKQALREFWQTGMRRATNEKIVSVGMRGDGDEPMSRETATQLLERIVSDQRDIIAATTGKPASSTPQLWALYKEVQDYYDKGMRVPDDITLLLCDDNWGNIRRLPKPSDPPRKGGYGIYYHFDYVGGPRNYKWVNTNPLPRVWEQMHLAWEHKAREIWIVNVGDIKPMELPISFFLDYAWNPEKIGPADIQKYTRNWSTEQFGSTHADTIATILAAYTKYNGRRKPELLDENTYSLNAYDEAARVTKEYIDLLATAERINGLLPDEYRDAYYQLVLHPVKACSNLQELYTTVAQNRLAAKQNNPSANQLAQKAIQLYINDSLITEEYHRIAHGKWNYMMSQTHIGYTYWQQPPLQKMPRVDSVSISTTPPGTATLEPFENISYAFRLPKKNNPSLFFERDGYISIDANHFSRAINGRKVKWTILPDHGRTGSAITTFPTTVSEQKPTAVSAQLHYDLYTVDTGMVTIQTFFSPTLNFQHSPDGLRYAISIDDEIPQVISINAGDNTGAWNNWVANNIIIKKSTHRIKKSGKHVLKYWMIDAGVVVQKMVMDFGTLQPSYLGPPETK